MIANALLATTVIMLALALWLLDVCDFLIPYRHALLHDYLGPILAFTAALYVNLFAAIYAITRRLFLKDTGRKLAHVEKQLRTDATVVADLKEHLEP
jgi:hypothetical protein